MMDELIPILKQSIGGLDVNAVDARNLWEFLESGQEFSNWIKSRVEKYDFSRGIDFEVFDKSVKNSSGGRPQTVYVISLDMAQELAMVENNDKGRAARRYFIECARRLKSSSTDMTQVLSDPANLRTLLLTYTEKVIALESKVAEQEPLVKSLQKITASEGSLCISDAARTLNIPQSKLFAWLRREKWIFRRVGCAWDVPHAERLRQGFMEMKTTVLVRDGKEDKIVEQARVTPLGLSKLAQLKIE